MNPDKLTPEQLNAFCNSQNRTYKVYFAGAALDSFMQEFNAFQESVAEEMLADTELKEARAVLKNIMMM